MYESQTLISDYSFYTFIPVSSLYSGILDQKRKINIRPLVGPCGMSDYLFVALFSTSTIL